MYQKLMREVTVVMRERERETIAEEPVAIPTNTIEVTNLAGMYI